MTAYNFISSTDITLITTGNPSLKCYSIKLIQNSHLPQRLQLLLIHASLQKTNKQNKLYPDNQNQHRRLATETCKQKISNQQINFTLHENDVDYITNATDCQIQNVSMMQGVYQKWHGKGSQPFSKNIAMANSRPHFMH